MQQSIFDDFTKLYSLSKTLKFELKPEPETKARFEEWLKQIDSEKSETDNLFARDQAIFEAYVALKPILDKIHEDFITQSLESEKARGIDFSSYFEEYKKEKDKKLNIEEKELRDKISECYLVGYENLMEKVEKKNKEIEETAKNKGKKIKVKDLISLEKNDERCLKEAGILKYVEFSSADFISDDLTEAELKKHLKNFEKFRGYLDTYNTNRQNYYAKEEKATAVATRIVHDNLPTFCNNIIRFEKHKEDYINIYKYLHDNNKITQIKDTATNKMIEAEAITDPIFQISHFTECLSQSQIEEYNRIIGHYNSLINLYCQAQDKKNKLDEWTFAKLHKQIGCGKRKALFLSIKKDKEAELTDEERKCGDILSVEKLLSVTDEAGRKYFKKKHNSTGELFDVPSFIDWLKHNDDWKGVYWSKSAVNKILNLYFVDGHDLRDKLKGNKACVSYDKKREEQIKWNDAIELSGLFSAMDQDSSEFLFKQSIQDDGNYKDIFKKEVPPSKNLIKLICNDLEKNIKYFLENSDKIISLKKYKKEKLEEGEEDLIINEIKAWFDAANDSIRIIKYFSVRKNKMKGSIANTMVEQVLQNILYADDVDWSKWYDAIRNYLTKKPQDDAKNNLLKLNFDSSSLLKGWSDGQEKIKRATLLKKDKTIYLCILKKITIFDTSLKNNPIYISDKDGASSRLISKALSFKTLAGKGFKGEFNEKYKDMGKNNPQRAIECLQKIIRNQYLKKYPQLKKCIEKEYINKQQFDKDINDALKKCYELTFRPINWAMVNEYEKKGELFLFKIHCKDYSGKNTGKKDLQTLYWESALAKSSMHQLSAGAKIFMRKPIDALPFKHKKGEKLVNKKDSCGNSIPEKIYYEIYSFANNKGGLVSDDDISKEAKSYISNKKAVIKDVNHEIIKNRRFYNETKYLFYCPIKLNFNSKTYEEPKYAYPKVNAEINKAMQKNNDLYYIGIDRGEKHLIYICILDKNGNIVKCADYDVINGTNYVKKLEEKAGDRKKARQNWQTIGNIKNLKEGYISHAVHKIVSDVLEHPSYLIMEDLSIDMKRNRQKIEKQIYQKFETALASKLNFVVDKNAQSGEIASIEKPLQLTPPIANYQDIENKKQFGIMLYTRASYTSVTDPITGWRKTIYIKNGKKEDIKDQILGKFADIGFDGKDYYFEYKEGNVGKTWKLYSGQDGKSLPRFRNKKENDNRWSPEPIDVKAILDDLFKNFDKTKSFFEQIKDGVPLAKFEGQKETAWSSLRFTIDVIQQIRNTGIETDDEDFLFSPVRNEKNEHFDSRPNRNKDNSIKNGDANGAYNIARKGMIMDAHMKNWEKDGWRRFKKNEKDKKDEDDVDLFVSDEEWDMWLLDRKKWEKQLPVFASKQRKQGE